MRVGQYRHRITIQTQTTTRDAAGAIKPGTWSTFATRWANVKAVQGSEGDQAAALKASYSYQITMRYLAGITQGMRISYDSKTLQIISLIPDDTKTELLIMATEVK